MDEMKTRGYNPDETWYIPDYRGTKLGEDVGWSSHLELFNIADEIKNKQRIIYPEHNDAYLQECLDNLKGKGICINLN